ncbi:MAG TPA: efflux RND transporter periplasmic adaptor subunit [Pelolinea sp.]|nr:efflux RND transporter periplasmic adaptor subunit [Pelolinea sp.]
MKVRLSEKKSQEEQRKPRRFLWIGGILLLFTLASLQFLPSFFNNSNVSSINTVQVTRGSITKSIDTVGVVEASPSAELTWESGGIIKPFDLQVGDQVEKGDILLALDDSSISPQILQARSTFLEAQIVFEKMVSTNSDYLTALQEINTRENILVNTYSMRHAFYGSGTSDERVDAIYASYNWAVAEVWDLETAFMEVKNLDEMDLQRVAANDALQAGILKRDSLLRAFSQILGTPFGHRAEGCFILYDQRVAELAEAYAAYNRILENSDEISAAQANLQALQNIIDQARIIAPFGGTITVVNAVPGEQAASGESALRLDNLDNMLVEVAISQMDINKINLGQQVLLTFDALPGKDYQGIVAEIGGAGAESNGGVYFNVLITIENADGSVKPGFTASVSIILNQVEDALLIPNQTIQYSQEGSAYVMRGQGIGDFSRVDINIGAHSDAYSELLSGNLQEGDDLAVVTADETIFQIGSGQALREARRINGGS